LPVSRCFLPDSLHDDFANSATNGFPANIKSADGGSEYGQPQSVYATPTNSPGGHPNNHSNRPSALGSADSNTIRHGLRHLIPLARRQPL
jgi:hypothetical protein